MVYILLKEQPKEIYMLLIGMFLKQLCMICLPHVTSWGFGARSRGEPEATHIQSWVMNREGVARRV